MAVSPAVARPRAPVAAPHPVAVARSTAECRPLVHRRRCTGRASAGPGSQLQKALHADQASSPCLSPLLIPPRRLPIGGWQFRSTAPPAFVGYPVALLTL